MSSYTAIVAQVKTRPHPNADRLLLGTCLGNQVVLGLDTKDGDVGVFFPTDGQLSHEYCLYNGLYNNNALKQLDLPESEHPGFFDANRRVRAQRFRQERSDGIWMPLVSLAWAGDGIWKLKEGDTFTEFAEHEICRKYWTPATQAALESKKLGRRDAKCFPKHDVTKQFRFVADDIPDDAIVYITEKLHGTSGRYGHIYDTFELKWWQRLCNFFEKANMFPKAGWTYLNGSKNIILEKTTGAGWYGTNDFRYDVIQGITLAKGEVLYFEIVGYVSGNTPIMPPHNVVKTGLKDIRKQYGDQINYTYGCPEGVHRMYVYSIVNVNEDGMAWELPWPQVVARCLQLGLETVPLLAGPYTMGHLAHVWQDTPHNALRKAVEALTEGPSTLDPTQIQEGVVVRVEASGSGGTTYVKNKSHVFGILEGYLAEDNAFVDPEDVS